MAELVDALVSNTNNFTVVPVRPRLWVQKKPFHLERLFCFQGTVKRTVHKVILDQVEKLGGEKNIWLFCSHKHTE